MKNVYRVYGTPTGVVLECECWQDAVAFQKAEGGAIYAGTKTVYKYKGIAHAVYGNKWTLIQDTCARANA